MTMSYDEIIKCLANEEMCDYGISSESKALELAKLEYEDLKRKGCILETLFCPLCKMSRACPLIDWEKRHPEYKDDELAQKIRSYKH